MSPAMRRCAEVFMYKWFRLCDQNSDLFRDLILMEVSGLNGIVRFIVRSVCKQFCSCQCAAIFEFDTD
jgi:hypothetical protein